MEHEMQHPESPTWCVHCGTYDIFADRVSCTADRNRKWDSGIPENFIRMAIDMGLASREEGR